MKKILTMLSSIFFVGCSVVGIRETEEPKYKTLLEEKPYELRIYDEVLIAEVTVTGSYDRTTSEGFGILAGYIFGKNTGKPIAMTAPVIQEKAAKIAMTAPVIQEKASIAMTAPVTQSRDGEKWIMRFTMPSEYTMETIPKPLDSRIQLKMTPVKKVAVITFNGFFNEKNMEENTKKLEEWIKAKNLTPIGNPVLAGYDPPWTIPMLRRNEIQVEVK